MRFSVLAAVLLSTIPLISSAQMRVGVFDSRVIALAHFRSAGFEGPMKELSARMKAAKEKDDKAEIARLQRQAQLHQAHMHDVVFGNASVNDFFPELKERFESAATEEKLSIIVSKWEMPFKSPDVTLVDITDKLVEYYRPDENLRRMLDEVGKTEPVKDALFIED